MPPDEFDDCPCFVVGGSSDPKTYVLALVKQYEKTKPPPVIPAMSEENIILEQQKLENLQPVWRRLYELEYNEAGVRELQVGQRKYIDMRGLTLRIHREVNARKSVTTVTQTMEPIVLLGLWQEQIIR